MKIGGLAAAFVFGSCIGIGATWAWMVFGPNAYPSVSPWDLRAEDDHRDYSNASSIPTKQLASRLLARVGRTFVADTRYGEQPIHWVGFFTQPKPYGDALCRVDQVNVPRKIVRGRADDEKELWEDDISGNRMYAVWKVPGVSSSLTREQACARYHDFGRLIEAADPTALERMVNLIPVAVMKAKAGKVEFKLTCLDDRDHNHPKTCDGSALLALVDPRDFAQVDQTETVKSGHSERHVDYVYMRRVWNSGCGRNEMTRLEVTSTQIYGRHAIDEGDVQEINIVRSTFC